MSAFPTTPVSALPQQLPKKVPQKFLVTGAAGFIGGHLCEALLHAGASVVGVDNLNDYYNPAIKRRTVELLRETARENKANNAHFDFHKFDLRELAALETIFKTAGPFDVVVHLAGQGGVRYSVDNPQDTITNNVIASVNILDCVTRFNPKCHAILASSSSVYGSDSESPFAEGTAVCNSPMSVYAASKKSVEMLAQSYHLMYGHRITLFRFFTVYGPRGRPDMAVFKFIQKVVDGDSLPIFGDGTLQREFTYISDIIQGLLGAIQKGYDACKQDSEGAAAEAVEVLNLGGGSVHTVLELVHAIESALGKKAELAHKELQLGDMSLTSACQEHSRKTIGFAPKVTLEDGIRNTVAWYLQWKDECSPCHDENVC